MKKLSLFLLLLMLCGCASSDRMFRMSGGVLDEYSAPKSSRIRSEKYQKISRKLSSVTRSNKSEVSGLDDTLVNIWPFFFRSNEYWSALWPLIDKDPYGFAFRPFYNHEGDDYSVLFPLSAWNNSAGSGWVTLFAWKQGGFGFIPLTWQWKNDQYSGGAYYTPLFYTSYDKTPLHYTVKADGKVVDNWSQKLSLFAFLIYYGKSVTVEAGNWGWLYRNWYDDQRMRAVWNYRFEGKKPFPESKVELENFRAAVFSTLPQVVRKSYGLFPLWYGSRSDKGDYLNRFLMIAGNYRAGKDFSFDLCGPVLGMYGETWHGTEYWRHCRNETEFISYALMSYFSREYRFENTRERRILREMGEELYSYYNGDFSALKPRILDKLKELDPELVLPETVKDFETCELFVSDLVKRYDFPVYPSYSGTILPLVWYEIDRDNYRCTLPPLLTWWKQWDNCFSFRSLPLLTFISRTPSEDSTVIFTPLVYYAKEFRRQKEDYPVFSRDEQRVGEYGCVELKDQYAALGLFYRGRFGFNIVKEKIEAKQVESLRQYLHSLPRTGRQLVRDLAAIEKEKAINDRWQTTTEIERLKKLIRYEEIKLMREKWAKDQLEYLAGISNAQAIAGKLGFELSREVLGSEEKSAAAAKELIAKYTELRFYEDIGNGLFFRREKNSNGDYNWHFCHILAGGEKQGDKESTHILHLLYRYRKDGDRSETLFFPFVSMVEDGEDSKFSFLWRVFSLSKRDGKTGGHILFIPFGSEW